ncbi:hypothetical protein [Aminipila luticellarii]|uniref:Uncharacterized protein n=1 Tax=Aminipila luticellarii TaxID=2507160 RepID=A0A410PWP0_9FIRM|nr:hypothetical protein [Aminipila luticellarii]QAT43324.1 hypothetical protein EQM06_08885 [Aminipila luticellarii]
MKTTRTIMCVGLVFVLTFATLLTGCGKKNQSGSTVDEPEITAEYLEGDYVKQLLRDGAEHVFGSIALSNGEDGSVIVNIEAKEYVEDAEQPNGFYIEDKNYGLSSVLAPEARCTFLTGGVTLPQIMTTEQFVEAYKKDVAEYSKNNPDYQSHKLYDIYIMGDQIELILEKYIP